MFGRRLPPAAAQFATLSPQSSSAAASSVNHGKVIVACVRRREASLSSPRPRRNATRKATRVLQCPTRNSSCDGECREKRTRQDSITAVFAFDTFDMASQLAMACGHSVFRLKYRSRGCVL